MPADLPTLKRYLGANVRRLRLRRKITQAALAERADIQLGYVQRIERGVASPSLAIIAAVADALGVEPDELLRATELEERATGRPKKKFAKKKL